MQCVANLNVNEPPVAEARSRRRVLHVVGGLDRGGIETWLARLTEAMRDDLDVHVAVLTPRPWSMEATLARSARLYLVPRGGSILGFALRLRRLLDHLGPLDVVHAHVSFLSGVVVAVAASAGVPVRIAHSHTDAGPGGNGGRMRRTYIGLMRMLILRFASHVAGSSSEAVSFLMGPTPRQSGPEHVVLPLAIDVRPGARRAPHGERTNRRLRIGHVGRFVEAKNHAKLIDIARVLHEREVPFEMFFVGDGPLRAHVAETLADAAYRDRVRLLGERDDVEALLQERFDVFVFPSHVEGFGLAALEAQAAGLPCVISAHLPPALSVLPEHVYRVDVSESSEAWADEIVRAHASERLPAHVVEARIAASPYSLSRSAAALFDLYTSRLCAAKR